MDLTGKKLHRWTVLSKWKITPSKNIYYFCRCECGNEKEVAYSSLKNWDSKSCWCLKKEKDGKASITHWMRKSRAYSCWHNMKRRCYYEKCTQYKNYWGRWITYDKKWETFEGFWEDMQEWYSDDKSLDRKDNNWNYCKQNCRWATRSEQARNRADNIIIIHNWEKRIFKDWMIHLWLNKSTVDTRIYEMGWSYEKALFTKIWKYDRKQI